MISKFKNSNTYIYLLVLLVTFDMELSRNGFNNTFKRYKTKYLNIIDIKWDKESVEKTKSEIGRIFRIFDVVCVWYPRKADTISHRLGPTKYSDRIIVMDNGNIVEEGNYDELMNKRGVYYEMYLSQAKWYEEQITQNSI
ncbi:hypothetical protein [Bacillus proteolyticus]|uniref:hypothetical protein n=1 Tax=Bacillus proteolyticus TaxID=2026192 RepID=UPI002E238914|nr:hypothetical protein [Bacillus proteolyticus]